MAYIGTEFTKQEQRDLVIDAIAVLLGDYEINRKYAATIILKVFLPEDIRKAILSDDDIHPFKRSDPRVIKWTKEILKNGCCERCGATKELEAHHIVKWADYPQGRADLKNGQCLCHRCHTNEHRFDSCYYMMKAKSSKNR